MITKRFGYKPLSLWQCDVNITQTLQTDAIDNIFDQIVSVNSSALIYLTVYPIEGFGNVSDTAVADLAAKLQSITSKGFKVLVRYASEMNDMQGPLGNLIRWSTLGVVTGSGTAVTGSPNKSAATALSPLEALAWCMLLLL
ncbi:hypothetical protein HDU91_004661 [Kappamyces sp. JEL0680]|nr:hypothetical protein HDU91_004661 [Kappamyces sp. JEL0680]